MSETYTVVLPGNIQPHFNTRLERDAFIEWMHGLQQRLHDAEAEREERERHLAVSLEATRNWEISYEIQRDARIAQENRAEAAESSLTAAHARIAALTDAVQRIYNLKPQGFEDWNNLNGEAHLIAAAALALLPAHALLSPAPADTAGGLEA